MSTYIQGAIKSPYPQTTECPRGTTRVGAAECERVPARLCRRAPPWAVELGARPAELEAPLGAPRRALVLRTGEPAPNFDAELLLRVTRPTHAAGAGGTRPRGGRRPADAEAERTDGGGSRPPHHPTPRGRGAERLHDRSKCLLSISVSSSVPSHASDGGSADALTRYTRRGGVSRGPVVGGEREHRWG